MKCDIGILLFFGITRATVMAAHLLTIAHEYAYFQTIATIEKIKMKLKTHINANK